MADWCRVFDFSISAEGWVIVDAGVYARNVGFSQTFDGLGRVACHMALTVPATAVFTKIELEYTAALGGIEGLPADALNLQFQVHDGLTTSLLGAVTANPNGVHVTQIWQGQQTGVTQLLCIGTVGYSQFNHDMGGSLTYHRLTLEGTGENPFTLDETRNQNALDTAFAAVRDAFQANPNAALNTTDYKTAIESAFGVQLTADNGATPWTQSNHISALHYIHVGLEAIADMLKSWVESKLNNPCIPVDRYKLFQQVMGSLTFNNKAEARDNFAASNMAIILIYQRPVTATVPAGRQAAMPPNNVIHELGHSLSRFSGFGFQVIGSGEYTLNAAGMPLTRDGMGAVYLRKQFYEHARVSEDPATHDALFTPFVQPPIFDPTGYLLYDLMGTKFNTWNSPVYTMRYTHNVRIDTFAQNPDASAVETIADAYLSWVRNAFDSSNEGNNWKQFFNENIGILLRNAAIWQYGISAYYQTKGVIPSTPITMGIQILSTNAKIRLTPDATDNNIIGNASQYLNSNNLAIYGWSDASPSGTSPYWLLMAGRNWRLVWVASGAIQHDAQALTAQNKIANPDLLSPMRPFDNDDLALLLGE